MGLGKGPRRGKNPPGAARETRPCSPPGAGARPRGAGGRAGVAGLGGGPAARLGAGRRRGGRGGPKSWEYGGGGSGVWIAGLLVLVGAVGARPLMSLVQRGVPLM
ncbi:hypothetical protein AGQ49_25180 [Salmonella enterica subsp. enterica]|nr:hypothetical protein AGQ49_25180 [Salmonella enterica subsp. enterica]